jgi:hypothetical protein
MAQRYSSCSTTPRSNAAESSHSGSEDEKYGRFCRSFADIQFLMQAILANDADSAIAAELWVGAAKKAGVKNMVMLTLGTGVGAGVVVDGKMVTGATGTCIATCPVLCRVRKGELLLRPWLAVDANGGARCEYIRT